jgi:hypothetical protein
MVFHSVTDALSFLTSLMIHRRHDMSATEIVPQNR